MFPLVETMKVQNGKVYNLLYHQRRLDFAFEVYFHQKTNFRLQTLIRVPDKYSEGLVKLRFLYGIKAYKLEFSMYEPRRINTLKIIENNTIRYSFKFTDRSQINDLFKQKKNCDDILIVKNQCITDTSIANIVFYTGTEWVTPETPLLEGTCRAKLLEDGIIKEARIELKDLGKFNSFALINAMLCGSMQPIPIQNIYK